MAEGRAATRSAGADSLSPTAKVVAKVACAWNGPIRAPCRGRDLATARHISASRQLGDSRTLGDPYGAVGTGPELT
jgi:hypothetical protein